MNFNSRAVSKIIELSMRQIDHWDKTHLIKPSVQEASGYGSVRLYSFQDLIQFKVVKTLTDKGISLQKIRKAIGYLRKELPNKKKPLVEFKFLTDGETIFALTNDKKEIIDTLKCGEGNLRLSLTLIQRMVVFGLSVLLFPAVPLREIQ